MFMTDHFFHLNVITKLSSKNSNFKDGKNDELWVGWHKNGNKKSEVNWKNGELGSTKYWNSKGEPVDTYKEAEK